MSTADETHRTLTEEVSAEWVDLRQAADRLDEATALLYGLNRTDLRCLGMVYQRGRVTPGELAEETGLTPGAITTVLDRLEKSGFTNRVADPGDRRRVLVLSTVAAREVGARLFGEVEVASERILESRSTEELTAIRDYLRATREVYEAQTAEIASSLAQQAPGSETPAGAAAGAGQATAAVSSAPVAGTEAGHLRFSRGAARVAVRGESGLGELYRARFQGVAPDVRVQGNTVEIVHKRRFRPFDWRSQSSEMALNPEIPWALSFQGGIWKVEADLRELHLRSFELAGGASEVEIWLPAPLEETVPIRLSGGASRVSLHRPAGAAMRAEVTGGASQLVFDDQRLGSVGGRSHFSSPGFAEAAQRYEVRFSGGASQVTIDTI